MKYVKYSFLLLAGILWVSILAADKEQQVLKKQEPLTREKRLAVSIDYGNGYISFGKTEADNIFEGEFVYNETRPAVRYEVVGDEGRLDIHFSGKLKKEGDEDRTQSITSLNEIYDNELYLNLSPKVPVDLECDLGVIKGKMDLGGLKLKSLNLKIGVSKGSILFEKPNPVTMESCELEGGVGKFMVEKLGNANIRDFNFKGGVGSYVLDFSGEYRQDVSASIELGMGKVTLYLPRYIGTRLKIDKSFLSTCSIDDVYKKDDYYTNDNWQKTQYSLDMNIDAGVGKIDVVWVDD